MEENLFDEYSDQYELTLEEYSWVDKFGNEYATEEDYYESLN